MKTVTDNNRLVDKSRGSLVGGAAGDALGYAVEFMSLREIIGKYGSEGIRTYEWDRSGIARFSDDTQMTLFTAEGLMNGYAETSRAVVNELVPYIKKAYLNWYATQTVPAHRMPESWLTGVRCLWSRRAPGNTCLTALQALASGHEVKNMSKGCGGVMRVAPVGIFHATHADEFSGGSAALLGGLAADITHRHIDSTLASGLMAAIVSRCVSEEVENTRDFVRIVNDSMEETRAAFPNHELHFKKFQRLVNHAIELGLEENDPMKTIRLLGEGWVGDEAIAIAIYCVIRRFGDFAEILYASVNHSGDSDSTGAIAGNIAGAITGLNGIPQKFVKGLEIEPVIESVANDLLAKTYNIHDYRDLELRYVYHRPARVKPKFLLEPMPPRYTPDKISHLNRDEVFVFGSNLQGNHGGGAAFAAVTKFGAVPGVGFGLRGQSYAIPTMQGGVETIRPYVDRFIRDAKEMRNLTFYVTRIGCGIAGFTDEEIAPLFKEALKFPNIILPESFVKIIDPQPSKEELAAIMKWKLGLGNMGAPLAGDDPMPRKSVVATADSWKTLPMPGKQVVIPMDFHLTDMQMDTLRKGHIPEVMEDHWFMYCDKFSINYYRSWTGFHIFHANFRRDEGPDGGWRVLSLTVNRDPEQCSSTDDYRDKMLFMALVCDETGADSSMYWNAVLG